jgi:hypothetical protein
MKDALPVNLNLVEDEFEDSETTKNHASRFSHVVGN